MFFLLIVPHPKTKKKKKNFFFANTLYIHYKRISFSFQSSQLGETVRLDFQKIVINLKMGGCQEY